MHDSTIGWRAEGGRFGMVPEGVLTDPSLSTTAKALYAVMALHATWDSGAVKRPLTVFADALGVSKRTVQRAMGDLQSAGLVEVQTTTHPEFGRGWNLYQLRWSSPPSDMSVTPPSDTGVTPLATRVSPPIQTGDIQTGDTETVARSQYWDALEGVFGYRARGSEAALWGSIINTVRDRGDPPDEIPRRALLWAAHYETPLTPATLLRRWDWLGGRTANMGPATRARIRSVLAERASTDQFWQEYQRRDV